jgi:hypothetical protein
MPLADPLRVVGKLDAVFFKLDIPYFVGGSLASSLYGIPRATQDVDVIVDMSVAHVDMFVRSIEDDFVVDPNVVRSAVKNKSSFNIIDKEELYKVDIFIQKPDNVSKTEMLRKIKYTISESGEKISIYICSPEDIISHKLYWFKLGDEVSERQWHDVLQVLKVQDNRIDFDYLRNICKARGVEKLLDKALGDK